MEIVNNYGNYVAQDYSDSGNINKTKKKNNEAASATKNVGSNKPDSTSDYMNSLKGLVPSVDFLIGNSASSSKSGKTLTVNPQLLKKMQNDPTQEKDMKELIKGVESMMNLMESVTRGSGWICVYKHNYIDENGKFYSVAQYRNDFMLNMSDKLREERKQNLEKLLEKSKEKAVESKKKLQETLEDKGTENVSEESAIEKAEQLINDKLSASEDGMVYLDDTDMKIIMNAAKENDTEKSSAKEQMKVGANIDLQV